MSYDYIFILKKINDHTWHIMTEKGILLYEIINCRSRNEAETIAHSWASSWRSMIIKVEE